jgi:hypothetical protein
MPFKPVELKVDGRVYHLQLRRQTIQPARAPRLVVVAHQPNHEAAALAQVCVRTIQHFTPQPHELWVVDNNSPAEHALWLRDYPGINVILNQTEPIPPEGRRFWQHRRRSQSAWGSYANALALELAVRFIDPAAHYLMSLHMDVMPCHSYWLAFLQSRLSDTVSAAGVRLDKVRTPEGVLHVLGCLVDFQRFRQLGLSFWPQLPRFDVGDRITADLRAAGYDVFACRNTVWQPELAAVIPEDSSLRHLPVDRAFDDDGNVIFLHLGRGVRKTTGDHARGVSPAEWVAFAEQHLLSG